MTIPRVAREVSKMPTNGCQIGIVCPVAIRSIMVVGVAGGNSENQVATEPVGS